jgi:PAS domain S-box-containing protein
MGCSVTKSAAGLRNDVHPVTNSNDAIGQTRILGLKQTIYNTNSREAFARFLCNEKGTNLTDNKDVEFLQSIPEYEIVSLSNSIVEACKVNMLDLPASKSQQQPLATSMVAITSPKAIVLLCIQVYPKFLKSRQYEDWKTRDVSVKVTSEARKAELVNNLPFYTPIEARVFGQALSSVDMQEVEKILESGSWLSSMLLAVENLPVCVSISTARKDRPGFPLIYVNAAFERVTGYKRDEIVGQNCRFLQSGKAEQESIDRLTVALRDAKPVRVAITNFRKDGMPFKNLLSMKPVFDENGKYCYVIGVQFDVTQEDATPAKLKLADEVIKMLPSVIVAGEGEEDE